MMKDHDQALFDQLLPLYEKEGFDELLQKLTQPLSNPERLLLKMEVRRLMTPSPKAIDLRGKVMGTCRQYTLNDQSHWLDDVAINLYHRRLNIYQGQLTQGCGKNFTIHPTATEPSKRRERSMKISLMKRSKRRPSNLVITFRAQKTAFSCLLAFRCFCLMARKLMGQPSICPTPVCR
nr:hypothetical protein [Enterovibrio nigricans]